jgi:hypothetical protein
MGQDKVGDGMLGIKRVKIAQEAHVGLLKISRQTFTNGSRDVGRQRRHNANSLQEQFRDGW